MKTPFRFLLELFQSRFFENDLVSPDGGFETNVYQVIGALAVPGLLISVFVLPLLIDLSVEMPGPRVDWLLRSQRLFFPAYSFAVTGFATVFEWDTLFPDRRDFMILAPFPIRVRDMFAAKFAALGIFLLTLIAAVNAFPTVLMPAFSMLVPQMRSIIGLRIVAAQIAAAVGASAFAFFAIAAIQGLLINLTSPRIFRRISPAIQMIGMSLMVLSLLLFPLYSMMLQLIAAMHPQWLWFFPPFWFLGLYDLMLPRSNPLFASFGLFSLRALVIAAAVFCIAWACGFRRYYRRTLESEDTASRAPSRIRAERLIRSPEERAIFAFSGWTLARSTKHRLFLATYLSVGASFGLLTTLAVRDGKLAVSPDGLRALPFLFAFFVVSGFRAAFQFPAELSSNWLFRITEARWGETSRIATRRRVFVSGLSPAVLLFLPVEIANFGWRSGLLHTVFQLTVGALLIEILFWSFGKVPFTCSYFPGRINLGLLAVLSLYGFTNYSFQMADLENALEGHASRALLFFTSAGVALIALSRRHPPASAISFDATAPHIQTLDLT